MPDNLIKHVDYIVIHCSDDNYNLKNALDIHKLHLKFGWDGIGYHRVIKRDGAVEFCRPDYWVGAHVYGHNKNSLGVCLIGKNTFTKKQFKSLEKVILNWKKKYSSAKILGHYEFENTKKTCPNFDVKKCLRKIKIN